MKRPWQSGRRSHSVLPHSRVAHEALGLILGSRVRISTTMSTQRAPTPVEPPSPITLALLCWRCTSRRARCSAVAVVLGRRNLNFPSELGREGGRRAVVWDSRGGGNGCSGVHLVPDGMVAAVRAGSARVERRRSVWKHGATAMVAARRMRTPPTRSSVHSGGGGAMPAAPVGWGCGRAWNRSQRQRRGFHTCDLACDLPSAIFF